jgi:hypothetical protein
MKNAYSFDAVADEVRAKHRPDFVDSRDLHPPLPDVSTCAAVIDTPVEREVPVEYPAGEWRSWLVAVLVALLASALRTYWTKQ